MVVVWSTTGVSSELLMRRAIEDILILLKWSTSWQFIALVRLSMCLALLGSVFAMCRRLTCRLRLTVLLTMTVPTAAGRGRASATVGVVLLVLGC